jgi:hypothetical protein
MRSPGESEVTCSQTLGNLWQELNLTSLPYPAHGRLVGLMCADTRAR